MALRAEVTVAAAGLALLAALAYGDHVFRGGLLWDDWENAATSHYHYEHGFLGPFDLRQAAYRPVLQLLLPLPHLVFGTVAWLHLLLALLLAVAASIAFYVLLRALGAQREFALAAAALALIFPWADSTRLWATASLNLVAVMLFFAGATVALRARPVRISAALFAAAILTYEAVAGLMLLLPLLYSMRMPWREALRRWRVEAAVAALAALVVAVFTTKRESADIGHALAVAGDGAVVLARALAPFGLIAALVLAALVALTARRRHPRPLLISLVALLLAWAPFAPAEAKYVPTAPGVYDRVNIVAGFAIAALVCSLAALARARAIQIAAVALIGAGWMVHGRAHVDDYAHAAGARSAELAAVKRALPRPPHGALLVVSHQQKWASPGVPVFGASWDLGGALKMLYRDGSIEGVPITAGMRTRCARDALMVGGTRAPYGRALLVDARGGRARRLRDARNCRRALEPAQVAHEHLVRTVRRAERRG